MNVDGIDAQVGQWRSAVLRHRAVTAQDADELEGHLRDQAAVLIAAGLSPDEAFLIAVKRLGQVDRLTAEYAREHGDRLWKQLVVPGPSGEGRGRFATMLVFAAAAAIAIQVVRIAAGFPGSAPSWLFRNAGFVVVPVLGAYFLVVRRAPWRRVLVLLAITVVLALVVNLFPFLPRSGTELLVAIHLPFLLWFLVGAAYLDDLRSPTRRMDFVRFAGEFVIYYALIAIGGGVLMALSGLILTPILPNASEQVALWVLPSGAAAAVIVAAWLVEAKKSIIENLAPVLTAIFTPLFAVMLIVSAVAYAIAGVGRTFDRDLLVVFDVLLLVVVALVLYGISARPVERPAGLMDAVRLIAVAAAIVLDALVLAVMLFRVGEAGFTPNRIAALGLNLVLLVNLLGTAWHSATLQAGRSRSTRLESWQVGYLPVFAAWLLVVVLALPPVFAFG
ncbi:hypothetical protein BH11ACT4_BH11ACT4_11970 [soil metagenome]